MQKFKLVTFLIFFLFFSCKDSKNDSFKKIPALDYEKLLLENSNSSLEKYFRERFLIISFPKLKIKFKNSMVSLDYSLNKNKSISKPFPSSPCGIDVEGSWRLENNLIVTEGNWIIPK